ncbi:MAG: metal-dependent transcriptional regulator [Candidatus Nezhaarchaeota archaeon]|nr:metal-dependent transcriptional regulator [Candidatus Nezhaarchaeota archaeon]MCX8142139.1 metal-dependent transcriptional regulator [Candidatus Nezhaarchaeota archaeon]MDW8050080.1 metal-dependent transcriptional regulator [Nitrososphaerota archaeon]
MTKRSRREEEYLEALYLLWRRNGVIRVKSLAETLNVKPPSIVEYLDRLAKKRLVRYIRHEAITLTDEGIRAAELVYERHRALKEFLTIILKLPEDIAESDACKIEHELHGLTVDRIVKLMNFFKENPDILSALRGIVESAYKNSD